MRRNWSTGIYSFIFFLSGFVFSSGVDAKSTINKVSFRPLSDFLSTQGSSSMYFPPAPDYVGWANSDFKIFALVDYAGLANAHLNDQLQTSIHGMIKETLLPDGKARVTVNLFGKNVMGFAQSIDKLSENNFDFSITPTIFGNKTVDIKAGAPAATGFAKLSLSFTNPAPGAPLPDFLTIVDQAASYQPSFYFRSTIFEPGKAKLQVEQKADMDNGQLVFSKELITIVP